MKIIFRIVCFFLFLNTLYGQDMKIIKENIKIENNNFELQELQFCKENKKIYKDIQSVYNIFGGKFFATSTERLKAKRDLIDQSIKNNDLQESQIAFEKYDIFFNRNNIVNLSIGLQVYRSSWEETKYYCFDLKDNRSIGKSLFANSKKVVQLCNKRLKEEENLDYIFTTDDLANYQLKINSSGRLSEIVFIFSDFNERENSGYPKYYISFNINEIKKYLSPKYSTRLFK